ncbi:hypothetical protein LCGC14_2529810 [marine sediment metagenome]|uniref:Uncharacterized protein n=1 Tax=marine sediment metagenome TaxID=412755 RepID=A0A0F9BGU9_9ZZZZ
MKKAINVLQERINDRLESLERLIAQPEENQSSLHYEHIIEDKDEIQEYRRAIAVLKYFNMEDVLEELLKRSK